MGIIILCLLLFFALPSFLIVSFLIKKNDVLTNLNSELLINNSILIHQNTMIKNHNEEIMHEKKLLQNSNNSLKSLLHDQNEIINKSIIKNFSKSCSN